MISLLFVATLANILSIVIMEITVKLCRAQITSKMILTVLKTAQTLLNIYRVIISSISLYRWAINVISALVTSSRRRSRIVRLWLWMYWGRVVMYNFFWSGGFGGLEQKRNYVLYRVGALEFLPLLFLKRNVLPIYFLMKKNPITKNSELKKSTQVPKVILPLIPNWIFQFWIYRHGAVLFRVSKPAFRKELSTKSSKLMR